jgi:hypothetical protein
LDIAEGVDIDRRYSRSPVVKYGAQKPFDILARDPETKFGQFARKYNIRKAIDRNFAIFRQRESNAPGADRVAPVVDGFERLDDSEYMAWLLAGQ